MGVFLGHKNEPKNQPKSDKDSKKHLGKIIWGIHFFRCLQMMPFQKTPMGKPVKAARDKD